MPFTGALNASKFTTPFITFIPDTSHPAFQDAMTVRHQVFVQEQGVPAENELDEDDARSFHWVVYASVASTSTTPQHRVHQHPHSSGGILGSSTTRIPVGTIRLIPPPHRHHTQAHDTSSSRNTEALAKSIIDDNYIKLGRLATIPAFRGLGIGKLLVDTALAWALSRPEAITGDSAKNSKRGSVAGLPEARKASIVSITGVGKDSNSADVQDILVGAREWNGRVLVHAQIAVKDMWEKFGFQLDKTMGQWDEEGIMHVGLWKQLQIRKAI